MRLKEGQVIKANGRKYRVEKVETTPVSEEVIQYDVEPVDHDLPARLKPHEDGMTIIEYHKADVEVIK